jgi:hypothetical protein
MSKVNTKKQKLSGATTTSSVDPSKLIVDLKAADEDIVINAVRKVQGTLGFCRF